MSFLNFDFFFQWEYDEIRITASVLFVACFIGIVATILIENHFVHAPQLKEFEKAIFHSLEKNKELIK